MLLTWERRSVIHGPTQELRGHPWGVPPRSGMGGEWPLRHVSGSPPDRGDLRAVPPRGTIWTRARVRTIRPEPRAGAVRPSVAGADEAIPDCLTSRRECRCPGPGVRAQPERPARRSRLSGRRLRRVKPSARHGRDDRSRWSLWSRDSVLSIASRNSVLSVGSVGSVLSIGGVGSAGSILSIGSFLSAISVMSGRSWLSVMAWRSKRSIAGAGANCRPRGTPVGPAGARG